MEKVYVKELKAQQNVRSVFLVKEKNLHTDKKGNHYISVSLGDKTGQIDGRIFDNAEETFDQFDLDDFVMVKGVIQKFQNRNQFIIHSIEVAPSSEVQLSDYMASTQNDIEEMFRELLGILENIKNPFIKELTFNTLNDNEIQPLFKKCPAAKSVHHAYIGGLLEHTLSISKLMMLISQHYVQLDRDLLLFGAVFHDIGKIWELTFDTQIGYSDVGRLVGHIPLGSELIEKKTKEILNFPYELKNILKHLVLSHHGLLEYGSPKRPKFLEAMVVGMIDDLDSKMNSIEGFMQSQMREDQKWTGYSSMYDRYFYLETLRSKK